MADCPSACGAVLRVLPLGCGTHKRNRGETDEKRTSERFTEKVACVCVCGGGMNKQKNNKTTRENLVEKIEVRVDGLRQKRNPLHID